MSIPQVVTGGFGVGTIPSLVVTMGFGSFTLGATQPSLIAAIANYLIESDANADATGGITTNEAKITVGPGEGTVIVREVSSREELRTDTVDVFAVTVAIECRDDTSNGASTLERAVYDQLKTRPKFTFQNARTTPIVPDTEVRTAEETRKGRSERPIWVAIRNYNVRVQREKP